MFAPHGIDVNSWVNLDSSCRIEWEVTGDEVQIEFGGGALGLVITEDAIDLLADSLTAAKQKFREIDEAACVTPSASKLTDSRPALVTTCGTGPTSP